MNRYVSEIIDNYALYNIPNINFKQTENLYNFDYGHYLYKSKITSRRGYDNNACNETSPFIEKRYPHI